MIRNRYLTIVSIVICTFVLLHPHVAACVSCDGISTRTRPRGVGWRNLGQNVLSTPRHNWLRVSSCCNMDDHADLGQHIPRPVPLSHHTVVCLLHLLFSPCRVSCGISVFDRRLPVSFDLNLASPLAGLEAVDHAVPCG